jgi:hypothetical protein
MPIGVSRADAEQLKTALASLESAHFRVKNETGEMEFQFPLPDAPPIPEWRWNYIRSMLERFETVFSAEMREAATYYVPRRGIFFTPALVDTADEAFPKYLSPHIPEKTRQDWRAAGRCLAFNLLWASGFHVARAVEGAIELYYQVFSGKAGVTLNSWHDYAKELTKISTTPAPSAKTLTEFSQMKDDYRNPIMHPRVSLTESDARMLFDNGESLIIGIAEEIRAARESGVQPKLAIASQQESA